MSDLIERQAAIDAIDKCAVWIMYAQGDSQKDEAEFAENIIKQTKMAIRSMLREDLPSAQPMRKRGKWIIYKAPDKQHCGLVKCPFCGEEMIAEADEYNFCPNCGADMRGDAE